MKKIIFLAIVFCAFATQAQAVVFCENLGCGNRFDATSGWASAYANTTGQGHGFCFEVMYKGASNYKVKVLAIVKGEAIHLDCNRGLPSQQACIDWLINKGYQLQRDGAEPGGPSGRHLTVDRGPIYRVPEYLYQK